jgi:hypothetical protein
MVLGTLPFAASVWGVWSCAWRSLRPRWTKCRAKCRGMCLAKWRPAPAAPPVASDESPLLPVGDAPRSRASLRDPR